MNRRAIHPLFPAKGEAIRRLRKNGLTGDAHGGRLRFESAKGVGMTYFIHLPD